MDNGDYDSIVDHQSLRGILAKQAIENGNLPPPPADRRSDAPRDGGNCAVCTQPLSPEALGYELQFMQDGRALAVHFMHVPCFVAWETQWKARSLNGQTEPHDDKKPGNGHFDGQDSGRGR